MLTRQDSADSKSAAAAKPPAKSKAAAPKGEASRINTPNLPKLEDAER